MKLLYLDCGMGAAGDMISSALLDLLGEMGEPALKEERIRGIVADLNALAIPGVEYRAETAVKCGIRGTHLRVLVHGEEEKTLDSSSDGLHNAVSFEKSAGQFSGKTLNKLSENVSEDSPEAVSANFSHHHHHHTHRSLHDIYTIIEGLHCDADVKEEIRSVYRCLAEAESHAHGMPVTEIHFHEVGTKDAIADIAAACLLLEEIQPDQILASPVRTGYGSVKAAHGILPIPAPATAFLLRGIPSYAGDIEGEMCTPTGAALLRHFVKSFENCPTLRTEYIGYGMGMKDFLQANCVRATLGTVDANTDEDEFQNESRKTYRKETLNESRRGSQNGSQRGVQGENMEASGYDETICRLECNVDDMTGEELGDAVDRIFAAGAREVFQTPVYMKKNRAGILLTVLVMESEKQAVIETIFRCTTTIGIREDLCRRYTLSRRSEEISTEWGPVHKKISEGYGVRREKWEYEDLRHIADQTGKDIRTIREELSLLN